MADKNEYGIDFDTALSEIQYEVGDAVDFMSAEFTDDWEKAELYYAGGTSLASVKGRSSAVKTEMRDAIRGVLPSIFRTILHERKPVKYMPNDVIHDGAFLDQQSTYINQEFMRSGGYKELYNAVLTALKSKGGPIKTYWEEDPLPEFFKFTKVTSEQVQLLRDDPDVDIDEVEQALTSKGNESEIPLYNVTGYRYYNNGKCSIEAFPVYELFYSRDASSLPDALVHGHRRSVTVGEAIVMGLDYDNWSDLDDEDPETSLYSGVVKRSRGYSPEGRDVGSDDITSHRFLLSEVYCSYDLKGTGKPQKYCFWLGGTTYEYIDHEEIDDYCIDVASIDPIPFAVLGHSFFDILGHNQDINSSVIRAMLDNAHIANTPRIVGDPTRMDFNDAMNHSIGSPIKAKGDYKPFVFDIPFTGQSLLPVLDYLNRDSEVKVGVTKAATGLDPNAMQSTDKDAVRNTIALAQGQVELMVRNIVETALIPVFRKMLRLTIQHFDGPRVIHTKGAVVPVPPGMLNPDLAAVPNVGLGTTSIEQKQATLGFILQKQEQYMQEFGFDNPFTSMSQMYNTVEDMVTSGGIVDVGRYFTLIDRATEEKIAEQMNKSKAEQAKMEEANRPLDPGKTMLTVEEMRTKIKELEILVEARNDELKLEQQSIDSAERNDLRRDELAQDRFIKLIELDAEQANKKIESAQKANDKDRTREEESSTPRKSSA